MPVEFCVPLSGLLYTQSQLDELEDRNELSGVGKNAWMIQHQLDMNGEEEAAIQTVEDICDRLSGSASGVLDPENFDALYSVASTFSTAYDAVKKPMLTSIVSGLAAIRQASESYIKQKEKKTQAIVAADEDGDDESALGGDLAATYRSAIKMYAFLLSTLINQQEKASKDAPVASVDEDGEAVAAPAKGRKKVATKGKKAASARSGDSTFDWTMQREKAVGALVDLLSQRTMYSLWRMASPEEEFGAMMLGVAVTLLEREENAKSAGVKEGAFALLALTLQKFPTLQPRAVQQLVHALQHCEALALPLAEAIAFCVAKPYRLSSLLADTLSEIAEIDGAMLSKDAAGARALSTFVINLSTMCPRALLANLPALETQLEAESYVIRNGCVQAMGALVENMNAMNLNEDEVSAQADKKKNRKGEEEDEKVEEEQKAAAKAEAAASADIIISGPQARSRMLGVLLSRVHDVSSFTRAKTLQQLSGLARARAIIEPASYVATMKAAVDRIMDKTGAVRRAAIQLLTSLMEMNPFSPVLQFELFQVKLQQRMENLQKELSNTKKTVVKKEDTIAEGDEDEEEPGNEEKMEEDAASIASAPVTEQSVKALLSSSVMNDIMFEKARNEIENLFHAINFIQGLTGVIPVLCEMFQSKTATDAAEAVSFFVVAKEFNLSAPVAVATEENAAPASLTVEGACKKMAGLIWSREQGTRESVLAAWQRLYFHPDLTARDGSPQQKKAALVSIQALLNLVLSSNMSELTSLEEILTKLYYTNAIPTIMIDSIWELVVQESTATHAKAGLITLVNYFSNASGFVLSNHVQELLEVGLSGAAISSAPFLVRAAMVSLQKWSAAIKNAPVPSQAPPAISEKTLQAIFQRMEILLLHTTNSHVTVKQSQGWYSMVEQVLNSLYLLHPTPEKFMENVLQQLTPLVFAASTASNEPQLGNSEKLSRFLFLLAHTAMRTLVHLETLEKEIKALKSKAAAKAAGPQIETERIGLDDVEMKDEDEEEEKSSVASKRGKKAPAKKATKGKKKRKDESESEEEEVEEISEEDFEEEEKKPAKKKAAPKKAAAPAAAAASSIEDDLASAAAAEYELEQRREIAESQLIESTASAQGLLSLFAPMVESIVLSLISGPTYGRFQGHAHLQINAVMALCKFMSINVTYCESNLRLLFSVLTAPSTDATIKGNIIIALGDLFLRFPNSIEPYSEYMYHGLKKQAPVAGKKKAAASAMSEDDEVYVRKNTLMVLTHLILNDMLKAKGPLAEIAKCTQDYSSHPRIAELSKCFFQELNNKTGDSKATIYNILPDIISRLSQDSSVDEEAFQNIFKFLLSFIHKDKQIENLIEKLINRFEFVYVEPVAPTINVHADASANAEVDANGNPVEADAMSVSTSSSSSSSALSAQELSLKQCRDLSYCLTQLPFSLVSLKKLSQLFRCYQTKLGDRVVFDHFMSITARARKGVAASKEKVNPASGEAAPAAAAGAKTEKDSPELQALCDELEAKYTGAFEKLQEEAMVTAKAKNARGKKGYGERVAAIEAEEAEEARKRVEAAALEAEAAAAAAPVAARGGRKAAAGKAPAKKAPAKSSRRRKDESSEEDEEEEEESVEEVSEEEEEEEEVKPKKAAAKKPAAKKAAAPAKGGRRKKAADSDDE